MLDMERYTAEDPVWRKADFHEQECILRWAKRVIKNRITGILVIAAFIELVAIVVALCAAGSKVNGEPQTFEGTLFGILSTLLIVGACVCLCRMHRRRLSILEKSEYVVADAKLTDKEKIRSRYNNGDYVTVSYGEDKSYKCLLLGDQYSEIYEMLSLGTSMLLIKYPEDVNGFDGAEFDCFCPEAFEKNEQEIKKRYEGSEEDEEEYSDYE